MWGLPPDVRRQLIIRMTGHPYGELPRKSGTATMNLRTAIRHDYQLIRAYSQTYAECTRCGDVLLSTSVTTLQLIQEEGGQSNVGTTR